MKQDNGNHAATPGPWLDGKPNLTEGPSTESGSHVIYSDNREIARVYGDKDLPVKANARLIAAAPELLEALEQLAVLGEEGMKPDPTEWITFHDKVAQIARAALDKARK